ncbi:GNAT family N-acetyltransferase [uncultured Dokdonia sp.]|uniref:GNAT family N-acetyltransferase n=1 Tax=uncultured Dokdonia sp. TaxID=575653 RepID=UPI00262A0E17|nr:GNAT family N-acetyltransferase [uncultured Dokdonia sp.]
MEAYTFETERLGMRPAHIEDAAFVLELLNTPKWLSYIGDRKVYTEEDAVQYITSKMLPQFEEKQFGNYIVIRKEDGKKIGCCGLYDREGIEGVDIGFAFLPLYEGKGYGYESASKTMQYGKEVHRITTVSGITVKENIESQRLLEKLGLTFIKMITLSNDTEAVMLYRKTTHHA